MALDEVIKLIASVHDKLISSFNVLYPKHFLNYKIFIKYERNFNKSVANLV